MSTTQPIRTMEELKKLEQYYRGNTLLQARNRLLITMGLNTALRIGDLLRLRWDSVYDFQNRRSRTHLEVVESKTGKSNRIALNPVLSQALQQYWELRMPSGTDYIFESSRTGKPIDRSQAYRIIRRAASGCGLADHISCHSLRKTFGYHAWKRGVHPAVLMNIYNHTSFQVTKRYLCIDQDDKDEVFRQIQL